MRNGLLRTVAVLAAAAGLAAEPAALPPGGPTRAAPAKQDGPTRDGPLFSIDLPPLVAAPAKAGAAAAPKAADPDEAVPKPEGPPPAAPPAKPDGGPTAPEKPAAPPPPPAPSPELAAAGCDADNACDPCERRGARFWAEADYLFWWIKGNRTPPLFTTGSPADAAPGALPSPGTRVLFGGDIDDETRSGARLDLGYWFGDDPATGAEFGLLFLGKRSARFDEVSPGLPVLAVPFSDPNAPGERARLLAFPGSQAGAAHADLSSRLWGLEADGRLEAFDTGAFRLDLISGFRYLELIEDLNLAEATVFTRPAALGGVAVLSTDRFGAGNFFYGGQVGAEASYTRGPLSVRVLGKLALGDTHEVVNVSGATSALTAAGLTTIPRSGFFAQPSNVGRYSRDEFAVAPEAGVTFGYALTRNIRATAGYTFLYLSDVARPGDQIDRVVNFTAVPPPVGAGNPIGPMRPTFTFHDGDFWAQGINLGLEFRY